jgi:hypothetical protein
MDSLTALTSIITPRSHESLKAPPKALVVCRETAFRLMLQLKQGTTLIHVLIKAHYVGLYPDGGKGGQGGQTPANAPIETRDHLNTCAN